MDLGIQLKKHRIKLYKSASKLANQKVSTRDRSDSVDTVVITSVYKTAPVEYKALLRKIVGMEALVYSLALFCPITPDEAKDDVDELDKIIDELDFSSQIKDLTKSKTSKTGKFHTLTIELAN